MYPNLSQDHIKAARLAYIVNSEGQGLITVDTDRLMTNIVMVKVKENLGTASQLVEMLAKAPCPVLALEWDSSTIRIVTHR